MTMTNNTADYLRAVKAAAGSADEISRVAREYMRAAAGSAEAQIRRSAITQRVGR